MLLSSSYLINISKYGKTTINTFQYRNIAISSKIDTNRHVYANNGQAEKFKVVICGGGAMGSAIAYNLAKRGWGPHTILIESKT